jgi:hypothetical protein
MIIRHWFTFGSIGIALGILLMTAGITAAKKTTGSTESSDFYFKTNSDTDVAFAAYGRANPTCTAWSDWQKTCSRLSSDGTQLHCNDSKVVAERSPIFCLGRTNPREHIQRPKEYRITQTAHKRFCKFYTPRLSNDSLVNEGGSITEKKGLCTQRDQGRPFAGYEISEIRHPYCEVWQVARKDFCTESGGDSKIPSCKSMEGVRTKFPLECAIQSHQKMNADGCLYLNGPISEKYDDIAITNLGSPNVVVTQEIIICGSWRK